MLKYDLATLDRLQVNNLQARNLELALFWADPYKPGSVCQRTFYAPNRIEGKAVWDVCYFNYESQIEVGAFVSGDPKGLEFKNKFERLHHYVAKRAGTVNFKQELCKYKIYLLYSFFIEFDTQGMYRMDDFWLSKEAFL